VADADLRATPGLLFAVDQTAIHDGPGLRMTVYLKGCPLGCLWCHSPESIGFGPEVVWYSQRCVACGACVDACPEGLRSMDAVTSCDRTRCRLCGACVDVCRARALEVKGCLTTAGEVADEVVRLTPFFRRSGGGLTLTGGEPTAQPEFSHAILTLCRAASIHTVVETTGFCAWQILERLATVTDLFLYDLKHADPDAHLRFCGVPLAPIVENLARLTSSGADVIIRVPLIPGCNDAPEVIAALGRLALECGATKLSLLPFNPATGGKYSWLQRPNPLPSATKQSPSDLTVLARFLPPTLTLLPT
jgi:pyruvate formate lyase activating enzyme